MSTLGVFTSSACLRHDPGSGHPEAPTRLRAVLEAITADGRWTAIEAAPAPRDALRLVHPDPYLTMLESVSRRGGGMLDPDTIMGEPSWDAALGGAGAVLAALQHALAGDGHAFAAVRPPGHHCLADRAMGFCLLANVAIAARMAQRTGRQRVLIVDWDVHHGNGTQALVEHDPAIRFVSLHESPGWPGTGAESEHGVGNIFNVPRAAGLPPAVYVEDLWEAITRATTGWTPDLLLISAGFDAMRGDPLGGFTLEPSHYADLTTRLRERWPDVPIVSAMEGGYAPARLAAGVLAHLAALA
ncbi:MAG: histone deacetylase family protein [Gemmatimonadales bacterium]